MWISRICTVFVLARLPVVSGKDPALLPEATAGHVRILLLALANQITARSFFGHKFPCQVDGGRCGIEKCGIKGNSRDF